jgi:hypothetical protein
MSGSFIHPVEVKNIGAIALRFEGPKPFTLLQGQSCEVQPGNYEVITDDSQQLLIAVILYATGSDFRVEARRGKPGAEFLSSVKLQPTLE